MHDHNKGILLMIATTIIFASQDTVTKHLAQNMSVFQFVGVRYLMFLGFALWWTTRKCTVKQVLTVRHPWLQILRGALMGFQILLFGNVIRVMGVGEMQSIFMVFPLMITAMSPWILGEEVGWRRWLAVCVGFIGTMIIIAPGSVSFSIYSLLTVVCAFMLAVYTILTRFVGRNDSADSSFLYTALIGALVSAPFLPVVWQPVSLQEAGFILVVCITGTVSHYLLIQALKLTPAVVLQPFNYLILPWAILLGYLVYDEIIPLSKWYGILLVLGAGLFVALRQRQLKGV